MSPAGLLLGIDFFNRRCDVLRVLDPALAHVRAGLADLPARAGKPIGDYPYNVTGEVYGGKALANRLERDVMTHPLEFAA
jgi:hypothetical protein